MYINRQNGVSKYQWLKVTKVYLLLNHASTQVDERFLHIQKPVIPPSYYYSFLEVIRTSRFSQKMDKGHMNNSFFKKFLRTRPGDEVHHKCIDSIGHNLVIQSLYLQGMLGNKIQLCAISQISLLSFFFSYYLLRNDLYSHCT